MKWFTSKEGSGIVAAFLLQRKERNMEKKHYCLTKTIYPDGRIQNALIHAPGEIKDYRVPFLMYDQEVIQEGTYCNSIEAVKEALLHNILSRQFKEWNLHLRRFEDEYGTVMFDIRDDHGNLLYLTTSWDGVMDAYTELFPKINCPPEEFLEIVKSDDGLER